MEIRNHDITNLGIFDHLMKQDSNVFFHISALLHIALIIAGSRTSMSSRALLSRRFILCCCVGRLWSFIYHFCCFSFPV